MTDELSDADLKAAEPSMIVKMACVAQGLTGLVVALSGVQLLGLRSVHSVVEMVPWFLIASGVAQIAVAAQVFRARPWAAYVGAGHGGVVALAMVGWLFYAFPNILSCMQMIGTPLSVLSAILAVVAVPGVLHTAAARQRLADQGTPLGF
ncbi:MAG: hypothetical protein VYE22_32760 [Myxococcota bacterium]|nr:hypothetical protein [Myxococcota bacterium]